MNFSSIIINDQQHHKSSISAPIYDTVFNNTVFNNTVFNNTVLNNTIFIKVCFF